MTTFGRFPSYIVRGTFLSLSSYLDKQRISVHISIQEFECSGEHDKVKRQDLLRIGQMIRQNDNIKGAERYLHC